MALGDLYLIFKAGFQLALILGSAFIIVPLGLSVKDFAGRCPLMARGHWDANRTNALIVTEWGFPSHCNFGVFIGCAQLVVAICYLVYALVYISLQRDASFLAVFFGVQVSLFFTISMIIEFMIVSGGIFQWCLLMSKFESGCEAAQFADILPDYPEIYTHRFLYTFNFGQIGIGFSLIFWLADLGLMLAHMIRLHKQERFLVSLRREARIARNRIVGDPTYVNF